MKLYDRPRIDREHDELPKLPEGVEVPDDISGFHPPTTLKATGGGIRWMRWLAVILVLGAVGVVAALTIGSDNAVDQADVNGSDRPPATLENLGAEQTAVDYMATYGTDNPVFVQTVPMFGPNEGPGSNSLAQARPYAAPSSEYMDLYGTDNPVFVQTVPMFGPNEGPGSNSLAPARPYVALTSEYMELYGTDNPVFVQAAEHPYADFFG
jgi:hypothetical protein